MREAEGQVGAETFAAVVPSNNGKLAKDLAKMAHTLDPNHPTLTVVAELGGDKIKQINALCPDIDIVGINSYAGGPSIAARYRAAGGIKPFMTG